MHDEHWALTRYKKESFMRSHNHTTPLCPPVALVAVLLCIALAPSVQADQTIYLSDGNTTLEMRHQQQWGQFGCDQAAAATKEKGTPLRIGSNTYEKGLGHHANGEITVNLRGEYREFLAAIGVQWQGGGRGSVIFRVEVDGKRVFESKPVSDSTPVQELKIPVAGARQLRLIASDAGDGIGCDMANWAEARLVREDGMASFGAVVTRLDGHIATPASSSYCGLSLFASDSGPQILVMQPAHRFSVDVRSREVAELSIPLAHAQGSIQVSVLATANSGGHAEIELAVGDQILRRSITPGHPIPLKVTVPNVKSPSAIRLTTRGVDGESCVEWSQIRFWVGDQSRDVPVELAKAATVYPPPIQPALRPSLEQAMIQWDWRMQDGIDTPRHPQSWADAVTTLLERGDLLIRNLQRADTISTEHVGQWQQLNRERQKLATVDSPNAAQWETLWQSIHQVRRRIVLSNPLAPTGPLLFVKRVPSCFSHQLTQYYGMCARPGGGLFVLEQPGTSMRCRELTSLPPGSYQHCDVSWDGRRVLFAYCQADTAPANRTAHQDRYYHLYEMSIDTLQVRQLTDSAFDDFSPRYLPNDRLLFLSTRRGGYHRCGTGPCPVYTLATAEADGSNPHSISYHETHEWDPAVLNDGRIIYTRWDYVDRHAVHYQQLWACRPDGSNVTAFYGNNTFNPVGVWEARPVPNSDLVMATAGAHHAMTAGSIIMLDVSRGIDGLAPITRLTPDALFPESEAPMQRWHATAGLTEPVNTPIEAKRWPGHCYRTPYPLSEDIFLAAYSFDPLIGEPNANKANMFGIYLVDRFGNKELLYRDLNIGSLWPTPLRARQRPPILPSTSADPSSSEGTFFVQDVYDSWPQLPTGKTDRVKRLRILQVLLKTTPNANSPRVGLANASPGKQVLGTVPVEADGSAYFRAPARVPLSFQALDEDGMAIQTMRSLTYLQPGEQTSCVGCHEHRATTPELHSTALALKRSPSHIAPGPDGSKPLSYPILVQGVLDRHCVSCHEGKEAAGGIVLTGEPQGAFTASYNALAPLVSFSEWKGTPQANAEPLTSPNQFGARASPLMKLLAKGHEGVTLNATEMERLVTWMDANALFYGTFNPADQARQQRGQRIAGPALE